MGKPHKNKVIWIAFLWPLIVILVILATLMIVIGDIIEDYRSKHHA